MTTKDVPVDLTTTKSKSPQKDVRGDLTTTKSKSPQKSSRKASTVTECVVSGCGFRAKAKNSLGILLAHYNLSHPEWGYVRCVRPGNCDFTVPLPLAAHAPTLLRTHYKFNHGTLEDLNPYAQLPGTSEKEAGASPSCVKKRTPEEAGLGVSGPLKKKGPGVSSSDKVPSDHVDRTSHRRFTARCPEEAATFAMDIFGRDGTTKLSSKERTEKIEDMQRVACELAELVTL